MVKGWLISLFLTTCWALSQILVFHWTTRKMFRTLTLLFIPTLPIFVLFYRFTSPTLGFLPEGIAKTPPSLGLQNGLVFHLLMYPTYLACFYYLDRPVTLRILIEFLKAPNGELTLSGMKAVYGLKEMIERRLDGMEEGGLVVKREERYFLTPRGERLGRIFDRGRSVLKSGR